MADRVPGNNGTESSTTLKIWRSLEFGVHSRNREVDVHVAQAWNEKTPSAINNTRVHRYLATVAGHACNAQTRDRQYHRLRDLPKFYPITRESLDHRSRFGQRR